MFPPPDEYKSDGGEGEFASAEAEESPRRPVGEAVGMEPCGQQVDAEPGEGDDDVEQRQPHGEPAFVEAPDEAPVQQPDQPQAAQQRAVFLRVPTPETPPRLVGPDAA